MSMTKDSAAYNYYMQERDYDLDYREYQYLQQRSLDARETLLARREYLLKHIVECCDALLDHVEPSGQPIVKAYRNARTMLTEVDIKLAQAAAINSSTTQNNVK